jgi:hypothetical protein
MSLLSLSYPEHIMMQNKAGGFYEDEGREKG